MKYKKKPVVVEACRFNGFDQECFSERPQWLEAAIMNGTITHTMGKLVIDTLECQMLCDVGDYIIQGVNGELYPCKPYIFEKTYEVVEYDYE